MFRLYCGDYRRQLDGHTADLIVTSPPYNIGSECPAKTGKRNGRLGLYDPKSYRGIREYRDNFAEERYQKMQVDFLDWCHERLNENGTLIYNHKPRRVNGEMIHPMTWLSRCEKLVLMEEIIWDRGSTHNHSNRLMWPHTERLYVFRKRGEKYRLINDGSIPQRSDVWRIPRAKVNGHNAPFPEQLVEACIAGWSEPGDMVMDPYLGSGTTAVVAKRMRRSFVGSERLIKYYRAAKARVGA